MDQFGDQGSSELTARFTNDMESLGAGVKMLFGKVVAEPLRALACIIGACFISWQLTLMFLILVPIAVVHPDEGRPDHEAGHAAAAGAHVEHLQDPARVVPGHPRRQGVHDGAGRAAPLQAATRDYYRKAMMVVNIDALADPIIEVLGVAAVAVALLAGSYLVMYNETHLFGISWLRITDQPLDAEALLSLYILLAAIADPVRKLSSVFTRIQSGCAAADRIFAYIDNGRASAATARAAPAVTARSPGAATLRSKARSPPLFHRVPRRLLLLRPGPARPLRTSTSASSAGETIALVGPNGCGKSTLVSLLPRFYDPNHGTILIDGHDLRTVHTRSLRQQIGVVTQEVILFDDTIFNNIAYGTRRADAGGGGGGGPQAFAHDFIMKLPNGYQTRVGELGRNMSGGQKQRLALARAILRNPSILILDEFTSAVDADERGADPSGAEGIQGRPDDVPDHAPPEHAGDRRPHRGAGQGPHRRRGRPRRADAHLPPLPAAARGAIAADGGVKA